MATLQTETITITLNKILKSGDKEQLIIDAELIASLEAVITELAGSNIVVEFH